MAPTLYNLPRKLCSTGDLPGNWKRFRQELEVYLIAAGLDNVKDRRKKAILLNVIGEEGVQIFNNFKLDETVTFEEVIKKFEEHCEPKKNKLYSRFLFYTRSQQAGEKFDAFLKDVKSLSRNCQFGDDFEDEAIRDRLILGTTDKTEQEKLLRLGDVDLEQTVRRLRVSEITKLHTREVQGQPPSAVAEVHKIQNSLIQCKYCGDKLERNIRKCPVRGSKRTKCGKFNHFSKVRRIRNNTNTVHTIHSDQGESVQEMAQAGSQEQLYCDSNTEEDELLYKCETCNHKFKRRGMLVNHLWRVHKTSTTVPLEKRVRHYPCVACPKVYRAAAKRDRHVQTHHPGSEAAGSGVSISGGLVALAPAACAACPRQYATRAKLLQHIRHHHPALAPPVKKKKKTSLK